MKLWWAFLRFQNSIDLYCARLSGNSEAVSEAANRIAECDRQLDMLEVQG